MCVRAGADRRAATILSDMSPRAISPVRLIAPIALVAFAIVFVVVVSSSVGGSDASTEGPAANGGATTTTTTTSQSSDTESASSDEEKSDSSKEAYVVKPGDNFVRIAEKTGIEVETLQQLNPDLDPQALVSGQRVKLR